MTLLAQHLSFRRIQTDKLTSIQVFAGQTGTLGDGSTVEGPWESTDVALTEQETAVLEAIVARAFDKVATDVNEKMAKIGK